jgi:hypothetical protein
MRDPHLALSAAAHALETQNHLLDGVDRKFWLNERAQPVHKLPTARSLLGFDSWHIWSQWMPLGQPVHQSRERARRSQAHDFRAAPDLLDSGDEGVEIVDYELHALDRILTRELDADQPHGQAAIAYEVRHGIDFVDAFHRGSDRTRRSIKSLRDLVDRRHARAHAVLDCYQ